MTLRILAVVACLIGVDGSGRLSAQDEADLIRFVIEDAIASSSELDGLPAFVCVAVKGLEASVVRDAVPEELPSQAPRGTTLTGASACVKRRTGAALQSTGQDALILEIGVVSILHDSATYTHGWFRHGLNAGASRCHATWSDGSWVVDRCELLWTA